MKRAIWVIVLICGFSGMAFAQSKSIDTPKEETKQEVKTPVGSIVPTPDVLEVYAEYKDSQEKVAEKLDLLKKTKEFLDYQAELDRSNGILLERFAALVPKGMQFDETSKTFIPVPQQIQATTAQKPAK